MHRRKSESMRESDVCVCVHVWMYMYACMCACDYECNSWECVCVSVCVRVCFRLCLLCMLCSLRSGVLSLRGSRREGRQAAGRQRKRSHPYSSHWTCTCKPLLICRDRGKLCWGGRRRGESVRDRRDGDKCVKNSCEKRPHVRPHRASSDSDDNEQGSQIRRE